MKTFLLLSSALGLASFVATHPAEVERVEARPAAAVVASNVPSSPVNVPTSTANVPTPAAKSRAWMFEKTGKLDEAPVRSEIWRGGRSVVFYATPKQKPVTTAGFVK